MSAPPVDLVPVAETAQSLTHNQLNQATGGIWRVRRGGGTAILKLATPGRPDGAAHWPAGTDPGHWNYWQREVLAYRTGLPSTAYPGIGAADLLEARDRADGSVALWLADVAGTPGAGWSTGQLGDLAHRLGTGQARWLGRPPAYPWLSRDWLRGYSGSRPVSATPDWAHPLVAGWPRRVTEGLDRLWQRHTELFALADALPQTLCHHDVWPMNLLWTGPGPVLLDWAFVGPGAIGEDAANLIFDCFADGLIDVGRLPEIESAVTEGYLAGLLAGGAELEPELVRRAVAVTGAAKYCWFAPRGVATLLAGPLRGSYDAGGSAAEVAARWFPLCELLVDWTAAALDAAV